ncbi:MAG: ion transporter [Candidatus Paracaedibacteraceae bacterium]|nr:ion transporter [Candidatus Paracaedibacteraceae bacterium]
MTIKKSQLEHFIDGRLAHEIIACLIILNGIILFLATSTYIETHYGWLIEHIDHAFMVFFISEISIRCIALRLRFFKSVWNLLDMVVILISVIPATGYFTAFRALRILRLVRLIKFFPKMRFLITSIDRAIPGMISISSLLTLFFLIFSIISFNLFKDVNPKYFNTIDNTMLTMFQLMINDNWSEIVRPLMNKLPYSNLFFIAYTVIMKFTLLNLFFGLIINSMQAESRKENKKTINNLIKKTELNENKIEIALEEKIDVLMAEIQSIKKMLK